MPNIGRLALLAIRRDATAFRAEDARAIVGMIRCFIADWQCSRDAGRLSGRLWEGGNEWESTFRDIYDGVLLHDVMFVQSECICMGFSLGSVSTKEWAKCNGLCRLISQMVLIKCYVYELTGACALKNKLRNDFWRNIYAGDSIAHRTILQWSTVCVTRIVMH